VRIRAILLPCFRSAECLHLPNGHGNVATCCGWISDSKVYFLAQGYRLHRVAATNERFVARLIDDVTRVGKGLLCDISTISPDENAKLWRPSSAKLRFKTIA
jgi:hypothetical protein